MLDRDDVAIVSEAFRRHAETHNAVVRSSLGGGKFLVRLLGTGGDISADGQSGIAYPVGREVVVRIDGSGRAAGRRALILGFSAAGDNGAVLFTKAGLTTRTGATILSSPEFPVRLVIGGLSQVLTFRGVDLASGAVYGTAGIVDDVSQVVRSTDVTVRPRAAVGCTPGRWSLTLSGIAYPSFFDVVA